MVSRTNLSDSKNPAHKDPQIGLMLPGAHEAGSVLAFFLITYAVTWSCWLSTIVIWGPRRPNAAAVRYLLLTLGTVVPALAGMALAAYRTGKAGLRAILSPVRQGNVGVRWYVFAILYMPIVKLAVALSHRAVTGTWPPFGHENPVVIAIAILFSTPVQAGEEIGWRGYALPRIAGRFGLGPASILVGVAWGAWHLPLFFLPGADKYGQSFPVYLAGVVAFSIAISWVYGHTQGSLLLTMLMHSATNQTIGLVSDIVRPDEKPLALGASFPFLLTVGWMWVVAIYFLIRMPGSLALRRSPLRAAAVS